MSLGATLGNSMSEQSRINSELSSGGSEDITLLDFHSEELDSWNCRIQEKIQSIAGTGLIFGNDTYGLWGSIDSSFVLGGDTGKLGVNALGSGNIQDFVVKYVHNAHDLFPEFFTNTRFIDLTNSTGSWNGSNAYYF
jgi:hypothetical protein